ncbi:MAG: M20/M25/M40 family metallo-hydrolase [Clostridia bacterium]|nr:M20/M25/M40 family metallo-hydrolase [Clostridia bacterium]
MGVVGFSSLTSLMMTEKKGFKELCGSPQIVSGTGEDSHIQITALRKHVQVLTEKSFAGRRAGTRGEAMTGRYLAAQLQEMGLEPAGDEGTFFQGFPLPEMTLRREGKRTVFYKLKNSSQQAAENILGVIRGKQDSSQYIVLSAHLDHLGIGENNLYPGANDNASGVATVLEIARLLGEKKEQLPYSVLIAFWSAEEMGLIGSRYFIQHPSFPLEVMRLNINLDSIGSGEKNRFVFWTKNLNGLPEWLSVSGLNYSALELVGQLETMHSSDHRAFLEREVPAVTFLAENWLENNHTPLDRAGGLNYEKMAALGQFVQGIFFSSELEKLFDYLQI